MIDLRPVLFVIGVLLSVLAVAMIVPALVDIVLGHIDWQVFLASAAVTLFVGVSLILSTRTGWGGFNLRQAFLMTTFAWATIALFGALPFAFSELQLDFTDAFFEAMSGVTTTGATVIVGLDNAPPGILLWRAALQWLGGIGIIVMAISILPILQVGGMQLFRVEAFEADKVLPRAAQVAAGITGIYVALTTLGAIVYWMLGMTGFDAISHAMTSIATGGYSTHDASFGFWHETPAIHWATSVVMVAGSVPFVLYLRAVRGDILSLLRDSQVQWMLSILAGATLIVAAYLVAREVLTPEAALRHGTFNVISVMTGTGYASTDFGAWGGFAVVLMLILMFIGGCAGSTTCGIKIFRFQIVYAEARVQLRRLMQPNGVFIPYYNHRPIPDKVAQAVMGFFFVYTLSWAVLALGLGLMGLDFITAISGAATAISNVGPGLGPVIGPSGTFTSLPAEAKWLLSFGMLLGRLELFTVLVMFSPAFWRG
ncbi:TrkH family potassium uptake protein [Ferruginivarius sediminum]|uniref:Trk system potassium uptake protein n=1 Tax=Ferruginivarius sediminum TaxID=2661937 RepID=A0A369T8T1_9PROT|nr:TrkH family potassium uptake protein [Ferruginivarius sediminum]RDD61739.1 TrkH family potassium uptake protein [Ferruginivarius sediminum]